MSTELPELPKLRARVSAQERQALAAAARIEEVAETIGEQITDMKTSIEVLSQSVDHRFQHVYGELADIKADTAEIRNLLASLVARLEKSS